MSTEEALITICDKIIAVPGNRKMKALGEDNTHGYTD